MQFEDRICFAIGVFLDSEWASRGVDALTRDGFESQVLSIVAKHTPEASVLAERMFGAGSGQAEIEITGIGRAVALGPLVTALQGEDDGLGRTGVAATIRRAGFQITDYLGSTIACPLHNLVEPTAIHHLGDGDSGHRRI